MMRWIRMVVCVTAAIVGIKECRGEKSASSLLDKMIRARGGREKLESIKAYEIDMRSIDLSDGNRMEFSGKILNIGAEQSRMVMKSGDSFFETVISEGKGWLRFGKKVKEWPKMEVDQSLAANRTGWISLTLPREMIAKHATLLQPVEENARKLNGLRFDPPKGSAIEFWSDERNNLIVKHAYSYEIGGKKRNIVNRYDRFKEFDGVTTATHSVTEADGKPYLESEVVNARYYDDPSKVRIDKR